MDKLSVSTTCSPSVREPSSFDGLKQTLLRKITYSPLFQGVSEEKLEKASIELTRVRGAADTSEKLTELTVILNQGSHDMYDNPIFSDPDIQHLILLLHLDNKITEEQLGTAYFFLSAKARYENPMIEEALGHKATLKQIPLFNLDGSINQEAHELIKRTIQEESSYTQVPQETPQNPPKSLLTEDDLPKWFSLMQELPPSERYLLVAERPNDALTRENGYNYMQSMASDALQEAEEPESIYEILCNNYQILYEGTDALKPTITDTIVATGHNLFNYYKSDEGKAMRMVPSIGMVRVLTNVCSGENAMQIGIRFKSRNPIDSNRNSAINNIREVAVRNPYQLTPKTADYGLLAPQLEFTVHDLYHVVSASIIPHELRNVLIAMGDVIAQYPETNHLAEVLYDNEGVEFRPAKVAKFSYFDQKAKLNFLFWNQFLKVIIGDLYEHKIQKGFSKGLSKIEIIDEIKKFQDFKASGPNSEAREALKMLFIRTILKKGSIGEKAGIRIKFLETTNNLLIRSIVDLLMQEMSKHTQFSSDFERIMIETQLEEKFKGKFGFQDIVKLAKEAERELEAGKYADILAITHLEPINPDCYDHPSSSSGKSSPALAEQKA